MAPVRGSVWRSLVELQSELLRGADARRLLDAFLALLIEHTGSTSGFLGEVVSEPGARPRFQLLAGSLTEGFQPLVDAALSAAQPGSSRRPVEPSAAPVTSGSLQLWPLGNEEELVGLMGLTLPPVREDAGLLTELQPMLAVGALLLSRGHHQQRRRNLELEHRLQQEELAHLKQVLASVEEELWDWNCRRASCA